MVERTAKPDCWAPLGRALRDYLDGDHDATVIVHVDDGTEERLPAALFFRTPDEFPATEKTALELCRGTVLDLGAGAGVHALALQARGLSVCAVDLSSWAVDIMRERGVRTVRQGDLFDFDAEVYDTVLMMMNGVGAVADLNGLDRFLESVQRVVESGGQILLDSTDVRRTLNVTERRAMDLRRREGRYPGEVRFRMEYGGQTGPTFSWLFVMPDTLAERARRAGWIAQIVYEEDNGEYLARLVRAGS